ncbi:MAG TPA: G1 family glutamic endopeptidase [Gaiellaceae bacterium]|nr:G1 family glutamic endopeptidase [Gaiellaceae bacterium]
MGFRAAVVVVAFATFLCCAPAWATGATVKGSAPHRTPRPRAHLSVKPTRLTYLGGRTTIKWSSAHAKRCTLSSSPRLWRGRNPARVKCNGRARLLLPAADLPLSWIFTLRARNAKGRVAVVRRTLVVHEPPFDISHNWSGYVVPSTTPVTSVSGRFTVPTLNCKHTPNAGQSEWVGIGGAQGSSGDLLQTGVRSDCIGGAQADHVGWWEEFPENAEIDFKTMSVSPGDAIQASVTQNADASWTTRLDDLTTGVSGLMTTGASYGTAPDSNLTALNVEGSTVGLSYAGGNTAEWIVEDFGRSDGSLVPLADFGTISFTGLTTSLSSWGLTDEEQVGIGDDFGNLYAAPSEPDASRFGFSVTYTR